MATERIACRGGGHGDFSLPGAEAHYPPDLALEPTHLDAELRFEIPERSVRGTVVTTVRANRADSRRLALHAIDFENVVVRDADGRELHSRYDGREIVATWEEPFAEGESRRLEVSYEVVRPVSGLVFSVPEEGHPERTLWVASDHETERARYWLPCVDLPAVRTTLDFHLTAAEGLTILANGSLESESVNEDGSHTAHWRLSFPCPSYLVCIAIGDFVRFDDEEVGGRPIAYFGAPGRATRADLERSFGRTPEIMRWLEERLGVPFPFPKYYQFALPAVGGAMENISLTSWDDFFVLDESLAPELGALVETVNVHEMAHSYFGDAVVIRDFAHAWLKESWATYVETCWAFEKRGEDEGRLNLHVDARDYMREADERYARPIVTRVFDSSWNMYDLHLYPGGACRLHMLRKLIGEEPFWAAVREYLETFSGRTVETSDFRRILEKHSGLSLVRFFEQWFYGRGYPKLKVTFEFDKEKAQAVLTVEQTQVPESPAKQKAEDKRTLFAFPLTIAWEEPGGAWETRTFEISGRKHTLVIPMAEAPLQVRVDPDDELLFRLDFNPGDDMLRRALTGGPDAIARILAAEELAKTGKHANLEAVGEAYRAEPFWGARREMAAALAESGSAAALEILAGILAEEEHPRVLVSVAARAGRFRDPAIAAALCALLDRDPGPVAANRALRSLGAQRGEQHLARLEEASGSSDHRHLARAGALRGLGETRTEAAFRTLMSRVGEGAEPDDTADEAVDALASCAAALPRRLRAEAAELLCDCLRDPRARVRMSAAAGLGTLKASQAAPELERAMATFPEQTHPKLKRVLRSLRDGESDVAESAKLTKRLEKLEEKNRKLEDRLDRLESEAAAKE